MPTTRSTLPVNRSGLQRGQHESKRKRSIGNADEQARKRHKDKINSDIDEEEGKQKMKGGRDGKKAKGRKKRSNSGLLTPAISFGTALTTGNFTGRRAWTKHKKRQQQRRLLKHISK